MAFNANFNYQLYFMVLVRKWVGSYDFQFEHPVLMQFANE